MNRIWGWMLKPRAWVAEVLLVVIGVGLIVLAQQGILQPIRDILDSDTFALHIGNRRFSLYVLASTLFIFVVLCWVVGIIAELLEKQLSHLGKLREANRALAVKIVQIFGYAVAFLVGLNILGIDLTALAVLGGALGVGMGFGLQKIASNFISGLILLFEKSVEVGDLVELEGGITGFVRRTDARFTLIETFQNYEVMIPNEDFITQRVTNWTFSTKTARVEIPIGVSYNSDIEKAHDLILEAARAHPRCLKTPAPVCFLREFADSSVNFLLFFWVGDVTLGRYQPQSDVMMSIWRKFKENNIEIPFPQRDVHIKTSDDTES